MKKLGAIVLLLSLVTALFVAYKVFAANTQILPDADVTAATGAAGRWTTYGTGSNTFGRLSDNNLLTGVSNADLDDSVVVGLSDFTLPAGNYIERVVAVVLSCQDPYSGDPEHEVTVSMCSGASCISGVGTLVQLIEADCNNQIQLQSYTAPDGSSWDESEVDALNIRVVSTSADGTDTAKLTEYFAVVYYFAIATGKRRAKILRSIN